MLVVSDIPEHEWIDKEDDVKTLLGECLSAPVVAVDTETSGLDIVRDKAMLWSIAIEGRRISMPAKYLPIFKPFFESDVPKTAHNAKFDMHMIANACDIRMKGPIFDTQVMAMMENTERAGYDLKFLASDGLFARTDPRYVKYDSIFGGKVKTTKEAIEILGLPTVANYASMDAHAQLIVFRELKHRLQQVKTFTEGQSLWDLYCLEEVDFTQVLYDCERRGILLDIGYLREKVDIAEKKLEELAYEFNGRARMPINMNSPQQLSKFFYDVKGRPVKKYTGGGKTGNIRPSVDAQVLKQWSKDGDIYAQIVLEHRKHKKLLGTYLKGLVSLSDKNNRIHTTLNQGGTETGRLSSRDPNLQNIPRPDEDIYRIREAFIATPGYVLIGADYDQLEMRIMAELSEEPEMIEMINKGWDIHSANASLMYNVPYEDILDAGKAKKILKKGQKLGSREATLLQYRQDAKNIGFGLNYGQGPMALAATLGCTKEEAIDKINRYFSPFPRVREFIDDTHDLLHSRGCVRTFSGRRRLLSAGMNPSDTARFSHAERQSVNTEIQGTAADIVRLAMLHCWRDGRLRELECHMLLQVHDELLFECPEKNAELAKPLIKENMEKPYKEDFRVNITASPEIGTKWTEVH